MYSHCGEGCFLIRLRTWCLLSERRIILGTQHPLLYGLQYRVSTTLWELDPIFLYYIQYKTWNPVPKRLTEGWCGQSYLTYIVCSADCCTLLAQPYSYRCVCTGVGGVFWYDSVRDDYYLSDELYLIWRDRCCMGFSTRRLQPFENLIRFFYTIFNIKHEIQFQKG